MPTSVPDGLNWFKSQMSTSGSGCFEAARLPDGGMALRHSQRPGGEVIVFTASQWGRLLGEAIDHTVGGYFTRRPQGVVVRQMDRPRPEIEYSDFEMFCFRDGVIKGEFDLPTARA